MRWWSAILTCCMMGWLLLTVACHRSNFYERHIEPAYDQAGHPRPGWHSLNDEYLHALDDDLQACYRRKQP